MRQASVERNTKETQIMAKIALDGSGTYDVATGIGFSTICSSNSPATV